MNDRRNYTTRISKLLPKAAKKAFNSHGFTESEVITRWNDIVGPELARHTAPQQLKFPRGKRSSGTLHILADSAFAPTLQHLFPILIEKINTYYGYGAVAKIAITQGPVGLLDRHKKAPPPPPPSPEDMARLHALLDDTKNEGLRDALMRLGESVMRERKESD